MRVKGAGRKKGQGRGQTNAANKWEISMERFVFSNECVCRMFFTGFIDSTFKSIVNINISSAFYSLISLVIFFVFFGFLLFFYALFFLVYRIEFDGGGRRARGQRVRIISNKR